MSIRITLSESYSFDLDHTVEFGSQRGKVADLAVDFFQMRSGDDIRRYAGLRLVSDRVNNFPHGMGRNAEIARADMKKRRARPTKADGLAAIRSL